VVNADPVHWQFGSFIRQLAEKTSLPIIVSGKASENDWTDSNERIIVIEGIEETVQFASHLHENLKERFA
jgi:hypothetical protein